MRIYVLMHHHASIAVMYGEGNFIGCFTSLRQIEIAKAHCRKLLGYSDFGAGFCTIERWVNGKPTPLRDVVYAVELCVWEKSYAYNYEIFLEFFWQEYDAEAYCAAFQEANTDFMSASSMDVLVGVSRYKLDSWERMSCAEGFYSGAATD